MRALTLHPRHEATGIVTRPAPSSPLKVSDAAIRLTVRRKGCPHCRVGRPAGDAASLLSDVAGRGRYMLREGGYAAGARRLLGYLGREEMPAAIPNG